MFNILRSDYYKIKKSKVFRIGIILCLALGAIVTFAIQQGMNMALQFTDDPRMVLFSDIIPVASGAWAIGELLSMGFHLIIIGVFTAVFVSSEFSNGTMKNILSRGASRIDVIFSKFIICGTASLFMLYLFMLSGLLCGTLMWGFDPHGIVTFSGIAGMILSQTLLTVSFSLLSVFVSMALRSNGAAIAANIICATMVSTFLMALGLTFGSSLDLTQYWIVNSVSSLATVTPAITEIVRGFIISAAWGIASIIIGTVQFKKRDVIV